jgi:WD repeat-containing protein 48
LFSIFLSTIHESLKEFHSEKIRLPLGSDILDVPNTIFLTISPKIVQINLAHETLRGLLVHWSKRRPKPGSHSLSNGDGSIGKDVSLKNSPHPRSEVDDGAENHANNVLPSFEFSMVSPPSIITESSSGGPWRKRITDLDGSEDDLPWWCVDCVENSRFPKENTK